MQDNGAEIYQFLLDTYETEIMKIVGIWSAFPDATLDYKPSEKSRSVIEQMEHQVQSEGRWMKTMLGIDTGDPNPVDRTRRAFIEKYKADAGLRLAALRNMPEAWWRETTMFLARRTASCWETRGWSIPRASCSSWTLRSPPTRISRMRIRTGCAKARKNSALNSWSSSRIPD